MMLDRLLEEKQLLTCNEPEFAMDGQELVLIPLYNGTNFHPFCDMLPDPAVCNRCNSQLHLACQSDLNVGIWPASDHGSLHLPYTGGFLAMTVIIKAKLIWEAASRVPAELKALDGWTCNFCEAS